MIDVLYTSGVRRTYKEIRPHLEKTREAALRMHIGPRRDQQGLKTVLYIY